MFIEVKVHVGLEEAEMDIRKDILNSDYIVKIESSDNPGECRLLYDFSDSKAPRELLVNGSFEDFSGALSAKKIS